MIVEFILSYFSFYYYTIRENLYLLSEIICIFGFNFSLFFTLKDTFDYGCSILFVLNNFLFLTRMCLYWTLCIKDGVTVDEVIPRSKYSTLKRSNKGINIFVVEEIKRKTKIKERHCAICKTIKPERSFHCVKCNKCYLKFDHHNALFSLCIGFHNFKAFIQLMIIAVASFLFELLVLALHLKRGIWKTYLMIPCLLTLSVVSLLFLYFLYLVVVFIPLLFRNETYNEYLALNKYIYEGVVIDEIIDHNIVTLTDKKDRFLLNPYNINVIENIKAVFGQKLISFFSLSFSPGDGLSFKKKTNALEQVLCY